MKRSRVFILDDEADAVSRMEILLGDREMLRICGSETNPELAIPLIRSLRPDLLFLDVEMPGFTGFEVLEKVRSNDYRPVVIFVTAYDKYAIQAIKASAMDYILKPVDPDELRQALDKYLSEKGPLRQQQFPGIEKLTPREREIFKLLRSGQRSKQIAEVLNISKNTVDTHRRRILKKLGLSSTLEIHLNDPV